MNQAHAGLFSSEGEAIALYTVEVHTDSLDLGSPCSEKRRLEFGKFYPSETLQHDFVDQLDLVAYDCDREELVQPRSRVFFGDSEPLPMREQPASVVSSLPSPADNNSRPLADGKQLLMPAYSQREKIESGHKTSGRRQDGSETTFPTSIRVPSHRCGSDTNRPASKHVPSLAQKFFSFSGSWNEAGVDGTDANQLSVKSDYESLLASSGHGGSSGAQLSVKSDFESLLASSGYGHSGVADFCASPSSNLMTHACGKIGSSASSIGGSSTSSSDRLLILIGKNHVRHSGNEDERRRRRDGDINCGTSLERRDETPLALTMGGYCSPNFGSNSTISYPTRAYEDDETLVSSEFESGWTSKWNTFENAVVQCRPPSDGGTAAKRLAKTRNEGDRRTIFEKLFGPVRVPVQGADCDNSSIVEASTPTSSITFPTRHRRNHSLASAKTRSKQQNIMETLATWDEE